MTDRDLTPADALDAGGDLRRLEDAGDFEVAEGYPDLRGWTVRTADGQTLGEVHDLIVSMSEMRVRYLDVEIDRGLRDGASSADDDHALVPIASAQLDDDSDAVIVSGVSAADLGSYPRYDRAAGITPAYEASLRGRAGAAGEQRLTLSAEELSVGTREVQQGEVTLHKHVETERVREEVPLRREDVTVERRPLAADAPADLGGPSEIRVPLMAEEAVVEKRAVVKEEIVIRKRRVSTPETIEVDLRRERLDVEGDVTAARGAADDVRDRIDGNPATRPGRDAADR